LQQCLVRVTHSKHNEQTMQNDITFDAFYHRSDRLFFYFHAILFNQ
jgi:hypothetical protein